MEKNPEIGCRSKKKCFSTREATENFAADIKARYPEQVRQYAYACEDCPNWHLTAMPLEAHALYRSAAYNGGNGTPTKDGRGRQRRHSEAERAEFAKLLRSGQTVRQVSKETGVSIAIIHRTGVEAGLITVNKRGPRTSQTTSIPAAATIENLSQEEKNLEAKLREIQARKQRFLEEKMLKISTLPDGHVLIKKEHYLMVLSPEDAEDLVVRLDNFLQEAKAA